MQPTFSKYGLKRYSDEVHLFSDDKYPSNAGKVCSSNVSESGGGEMKHIRDKSNSNSPIRSNVLSVVNPKQIQPVFSTIPEVRCTKDLILFNRIQKKIANWLRVSQSLNQD